MPEKLLLLASSIVVACSVHLVVSLLAVWNETNLKDFYVIKFRIEDFNPLAHLKDGGPQIDTAEGIVRRVVAKTTLTYEDRIAVLEEVIDSCQVDADFVWRLYEEVLKHKKNGTLESDAYYEFLVAHCPVNIDDETSCPVFYQPSMLYDLPLYWAFKEWPFMTPEIHGELLAFIETIRRALKMLQDGELSRAVFGTPQPVQITSSEPETRFSTIQWLGNTEDFHRLIDQLERVLWLAPQSYAGLARFFFDKDGNPMSSEAPGSAPLKRVQWIGSTIDFYRVSWYLDDQVLIPERSLQKFARLFLDSKGKPMKDDSNSLKIRDGKYDGKLDVKVKDLIDRIAKNEHL